jgi:hypothetical protein
MHTPNAHLRTPLRSSVARIRTRPRPCTPRARLGGALCALGVSHERAAASRHRHSLQSVRCRSASA